MPEAEVIPLRGFRTAQTEELRPGTVSRFSLEATNPRPNEVGRLAELLAPDTRVFLSALPHVSPERQIEMAAAVRRAGLEPVPHLAARQMPGREALSDYLDRMTGEAGVERYMLIAGDLARPRGPYGSSLELMRDDRFLRAPLKGIGLAGYPEGHPILSDQTLEAALDDKLAAAREAGLEPEIVTQFCFDAAAIIAWYGRLRLRGIEVPVRVGLAGPANARTLLKFALRCGVNLPLRKANIATRLLRGASVDQIVAKLRTRGLTGGRDQSVSLHFYSFGGLERTARWAQSGMAAAE